MFKLLYNKSFRREVIAIKKTFSILTLGCKVNQYESEAVAEMFNKKGYLNLDYEIENSDIFIVNTCTVTNLSDRKSRQAIRKVKRNNPDAIVAVMGCYSQVAPEKVEKIEGVDIIIGTTERDKIVELVENFEKENEQVNIVRSLKYDHEFQKIHTKHTDGMTRAYMKVQDGCNRFCSYCIIPYARGPIRSRTIEDAVEEAKELTENGYKEIILTGIHVGSYGYDLGKERLIDLIEAIAEVDKVKRIRLSSIEQGIISEEFLERAMKTGKLCDHFHLSLQSGSDEILKKMNRKYTCDEFYEKTELIRKYMPDAGLTTDVIVGFPEEKEENFKESLEFIKKVKFSKIHIFKYSKRAGTPAAEIKDQVDGNIKIERAEKLAEVNEQLMKDFKKENFGKIKSLLVEEEFEKGKFLGYTTNYIRCLVESEKDIKNQVLDVEIKDEIDSEIAKVIIV